MDRIKVLIADDHAIVRMGLVALLGNKDFIEIAGEAENGEEAVAKAVRLRPDVVVLDLMMPVMDGIRATEELKARLPGTGVLVLTTSTVSDELDRALKAGADGIVLKSAANRELVSAIRAVADGKKAVSPQTAALLSADPPMPGFTPRQRDVLKLMVDGRTNREIACALGIRPDGVDQHVIAILEKLGAANRTEAAVIAVRRHLV